MRADVLAEQLVVGHDDHARHRRVDQRERPVLELRGRVGLGVDVGDLLELLRALAGDRGARAPGPGRTSTARRRSAAATSATASDVASAASTASGSRAQPVDQPRAVRRGQVAHPPEQQREQRERRWPSSVNALVDATDTSGPACRNTPAAALAGDRRADDVDDADDPPALALELLDGGERVDGLAGLADRDVERLGVDERVAVAELAGRLGVGGDAGELLDEAGADLAGVVAPTRSRGT